MIVESLKLKNYRNYELLDIVFDPATNILYGDNVQGKTNILEALYLCGTTKMPQRNQRPGSDSIRRRRIPPGSDDPKKNMEFQIDIHLKKSSPKGIAVNKLRLKKAAELFGIIHFVFFSPEDLNIIKEGPGRKKKVYRPGIISA